MSKVEPRPSQIDRNTGCTVIDWPAVWYAHEHLENEGNIDGANAVRAMHAEIARLTAVNLGAVEEERRLIVALIRSLAEGSWDPAAEAALREAARQIASREQS